MRFASSQRRVLVMVSSRVRISGGLVDGKITKTVLSVVIVAVTRSRASFSV